MKLPKIFWEKRKKIKEILLKNKKINKSNYDCLIPVSGGKDSYFQTHIITQEFGLKPLLMTYDGNNWLPEGEYNRNQMKNKFDADHIMWSPSVKVLKKIESIILQDGRYELASPLWYFLLRRS